MKKKKETQNQKGMTRREFIVTTGAATGAALVTASVGPFVHTTMAKGGTLKVCSYGGSYQESQRKALIQPFADKFGVKIIEASGPDIAKVKAQVDNKAYEWDVVDLETRHIARGELENLLEPIDTNVVNLDGIDKKAIRKAAIGNIFWTTSLAFNKKALGDKKACSSWADFWDVKNFPGPRALQDQAPFNLEFALLADGVPMNKIYPIDVNRAFKKMDEIKDHITSRAKNNELPCAVAHKIAADLNVPPAEIGKTADLLEMMLVKCQLGLFGYTPHKKIVKPEAGEDPDLMRAIEDSRVEGNISCASAWEIARRFDVSKMKVSSVCEQLKIKIKPCQLGAF